MNVTLKSARNGIGNVKMLRALGSHEIKRRREWDSNPRGSRLAVFKTAAFDRSAIPPARTARLGAESRHQYTVSPSLPATTGAMPTRAASYQCSELDD